MTTSNHIRILKAGDVAHHAVVTLPRPTPNPTDDDGGPEIIVEPTGPEPVAPTTSTLEPALRRLADGLSGLALTEADVRSAAMRSDAEEIVDTALAVARWILHRELEDPATVLDLARRALAGVGDPRAVKLRVHPDLIDPVSELAPEDLALVADDGVAPGEFVVETDGPDVSLRFDRALDEARRALTEGEEAS